MRRVNHAIGGPAENLATRGFELLLVVSLYYTWYRYPFQINSATTSPHYSDTPAWLQQGKYILVVMILVVVALIAGMAGAHRRKVPIGAAAFIGPCLLLLSGFAIVKGSAVGNDDSTKLGVILIVGVVLITLSLRWKLDGVPLVRIFSVFAVVVIVVEIIQVALLLTTGRLPALAYGNSVSIRFGSILDDPNGLAFLMPLLLGAVLLTWKRIFWRVLVSLGLIMTLALTQSLSGISSCVLALLLGTFILRWQSPARVLAVFWLVAAMVATAAIWLLASGVGASIFTAKSGSLNAHATVYSQWGSFDALTLLGMSQGVSGSESSFVNLVLQFGLPFTILYTLLGLAAIVRLAHAIRAQNESRSKVLYTVFFYYLVAYLIGSINLRLNSIFPLNILFVIGIAVSVFAATESSWPIIRRDQKRSVASV